MDQKTALLWWQLNVLSKRRYEAILEVYGSLDEASKHVGEEFLRGLGVRDDAVRAALIRLETFDADTMAKKLIEKEVTLLSIDDEAFPAILRQMGDPPIFLSYLGDLSCLTQPLIAVVGTRGMTAYGRRVVGEFVPRFVQAGCVTVSGLAQGIDTVVAQETLRAGGRTVAVLGHGLGNIFPTNNVKLADEILEKGGLLLSEFPIDMSPDFYTFPSRNRLIAGLGLGTLVIEAPAKSGALITAELALDYDRDVFAVPGPLFDPNAVGVNDLIARGLARLVTAPDDVLREIGIVAPDGAQATSSYTPETEDEKKVWKALTTMPQPVDDLVVASGLPAPAVAATLTMMELAGVTKKVGAGRWVRG
ncbi:DNA-protecting protein DprA [Candidatus Peregrinibacteria bacterium]|nr:DNA-protecting protein DprA [Candidatus Peregrinibacteria bacterium]